MKKDPHSLIPHLDNLYRAGFARLTPPTAKIFPAWQSRKRAELRNMLAVPTLRVLRARARGKRMRGDVHITILDLSLSDGTMMTVYRGELAHPKVPYRPLLMYHGHSDGAQTLFGFKMTKARQDYALEFVRRGYTVFAPDQRGFGRRLGPSPVFYGGYTRSCRQVAFDLLLLGKTILGERVGDAMALADWVRKESATKTPCVVTGNSGGGTVALLHAALDTRVDAAMVGSAFCPFKASIMELPHCECNYIPGLLQSFREIWEVGALLAPRPLLIVHGKKDPIFPARATRQAVAELVRYYALAGAKSASVAVHVHSGAHWYDHGKVFSFLDGLKRV